LIFLFAYFLNKRRFARFLCFVSNKRKP